MSQRGMALAGFLAAYFPVIAAVLAFGLDRFWEQWLKQFTAPILAGVLMVQLAEFVRSEQSRQRYEAILLTATEKIDPVVSVHSIEGAFAEAFRLRPKPRKIRVFGLTSYKIQPLIESNVGEFPIESVQLLLADPHEYLRGASHVDFIAESNLTICWKWLGMVKKGLILKLHLNQFDFYPTEWYVILDEELVIVGHYRFDSDNIAKAATAGSVFMARNVGAGSRLIESYLSKFDHLFGVSDKQFGSAELSGIVRAGNDLREGHWPHGSARLSSN